MPSPFTPGADFRLRIGLLIALIVLVGVPVVSMIYVRTPFITESGVAPLQPVPFDHRHHVTDDGIECLYCHDGADRSPHAGIPPASVCMGCHGQVRRYDPVLEPVRRSFYEHRPIVWRRVHDLHDFAFFDHSIHVTRGIECARCHGAVEDMAVVEKVYSMNMGWCLDCHVHRPPPFTDLEPGDPVGPNHCSACHR